MNSMQPFLLLKDQKTIYTNACDFVPTKARCKLATIVRIQELQENKQQLTWQSTQACIN